MLVLYCLQPQTNGSSLLSVVKFLLDVLPMDLYAMAQDCLYLVEWWNMENTAMIFMNCR